MTSCSKRRKSTCEDGDEGCIWTKGTKKYSCVRNASKDRGCGARGSRRQGDMPACESDDACRWAKVDGKKVCTSQGSPHAESPPTTCSMRRHKKWRGMPACEADDMCQWTTGRKKNVCEAKVHPVVDFLTKAPNRPQPRTPTEAEECSLEEMQACIDQPKRRPSKASKGQGLPGWKARAMRLLFEKSHAYLELMDKEESPDLYIYWREQLLPKLNHRSDLRGACCSQVTEAQLDAV
jgi:hypothetical protein